MPELPSRPPFAIRARLVSPLADGTHLDEADGVLEVDAAGTIARVGAWSGTDAAAAVVDLRPLVVMPGLVDLHLHLPQLPNAGLGAGLDLLTWLERYIFPLEAAYDRARADVEAPAAFRAIAAAGTTTVVAYAALWADSTDAVFAAAEAHGIRAVVGKVMMDRGTYDTRIDERRILQTSLLQSDDLASRWHGRDRGRLRYAFTPRFAVSCTAEMLRESASLAVSHGAYWQTHIAEDRRELAEVAALFPDASDYLDVYERAGALGPRTLLAHAVHLSDAERSRLVQAGAAVAHCPASNLFLASGMMPLAEYRARGMRLGLGTDVAAGPDLSVFGAMRAGAVTQRALVASGAGADGILGPLEWLRLATLDGASALGIEGETGSLERGKDADLIAVDPRLTAPLPGVPTPSDANDLVSRMIFRAHPDMVRGAWVRGRRLEGPPGSLGIG